jgi:CelD/BcsL family acetyltransferase involved in cellulose biosynthesis
VLNAGPPHVLATTTLDPAEDPRWAALLRRRPSSSVFHSPPWLRALRDTYGFEFRAEVVLDPTGQATQGWAHCLVQDVMDPRIVSLPFSDYCDPLVDDVDSWLALTGGVVDAGVRTHLRCLDTGVPLADPRFTVTDRARWHGVDLALDDEARWHALDGSTRRAIRRARDQGITVSVAEDVSELRAFFELHLRVRRHKYGLLAQPYRFFLALWERFLATGDGALMLARRGEDVVGGVLFLGWGDTLYYKFNASDAHHLTARPNDLIVWESLALARSRGYRLLDFGLSSWDQDGLVRFKRKYASDERTIHLLRHAPTEPSARERETRALLGELTGILVGADVPDHVTEEAGDALYRYFV